MYTESHSGAELGSDTVNGSAKGAANGVPSGRRLETGVVKASGDRLDVYARMPPTDSAPADPPYLFHTGGPTVSGADSGVGLKVYPVDDVRV